MDLMEKVMNFGHKRGLKDIENQIQKAIKKKRLSFLPNDKFAYTDKQGIKGEYGINDMVRKMIVAGNWQEQMKTLGIDDSEVKEILMREHKKGGK